jgi:hypothetical protein
MPTSAPFEMGIALLNLEQSLGFRSCIAKYMGKGYIDNIRAR